MWAAGQRLAGYIRKGQRPIILHMTDHDPSGLDMTGDVGRRLETFAGVPITVARIALTMRQVTELNPPPNPAKLTDSRAASYVAEYGDESWELDALPPDQILALVDREVGRLRDESLWSAALAQEAADRRALEEVADDFA